MRAWRSDKTSSTWNRAAAVILFFFCGIASIYPQSPQADFSIQTNACIDEKLIVSNHSLFGETYSWDFCEGDLMSTVAATSGASLIGAFNPKDMDVVEDDGALYGFVTSRSTNAIYRIYFPLEENALPVVTNLGNVGSLLSGPEQIKIVKEDELWYGLVVNGATSSLIRILFGSSLNNVPSAENTLVGISTVNSGMDVVSWNGDWIAAITNSATQKLTIVNFGTSITNDPELADIVVTPSIPGISAADDLQLIYHNGSWYAFVIGFNSRSIHRLKFGADLFSTPEMSVITAPPFSTNQRPSGIRVHRDAGKFIMFVQTFDGTLFRFNLDTDIENSSPPFVDLGTFGLLRNSVNLELIKNNSMWYGFVINQSNLKVDRIFFDDVCPATASVSNKKLPDSVAYTEAGIYAVSLTVQGQNRNTDYRSQHVNISPLVSPKIEIFSQNVCVRNVVHFRIQTVDEVSSYYWDFGDQSSISTAAAPDYQFSQAGPFDVMLKVAASNGCSNTASKRVTIYEAPIADFSFAAELCTNSEIKFTNSTPDIYDGNLSYQWFVDSNVVSVSRDLQYTFTSTGSKTIKLKTAIPGCEDETTYVTPQVHAGPIVDFSFSGTCEGDLFAFQQQISDPIESYLWNFDDGNTSADAEPRHQFATFGNYSVSLTAMNAVGCENVKTKAVPVYGNPVIDFSAEGPPNICSNAISLFQNTTTNPDSRPITQWLWQYNDSNAPITTTDLNGQHVFEQPGTYPVSLTATTAAGCTATLEKEITIHPSPSTTFTQTPACEDVPVLFTGPPDPLIQSSYWEIGTSYSYDASPTHTFSAPGNYPLYAEFYGSNGCIATVQRTIHVPIPLSPDFSVIKNCVDHEAIFTDITTGIDPVATRTWDFGDGLPSTASPVNHSFTQQGAVPVTLQVTSQSGCAYKTTKQVKILPAPVAEFSASPETGAYPLDVMFTNTSTNADQFQWRFLDGTASTSNEKAPAYTFSTLGTFDVTLTALNAQQCEDTFTKSISTVAPLPDADIQMIKLLQQPDGSTKLIVTIHNKGNTILKNLPMAFDFSGDVSFSQTVPDVIMPGALYNFVLNSAILNAENLAYLCVALDVQNDLSPNGNRSCSTLDTELFVFPAYPNPANDALRLEWLAPASQTVTVSLTDHLGRTIFRQKVSGILGLNSHIMNLEALPVGLYLLIVEDQSSRTVQRVAVER